MSLVSFLSMFEEDSSASQSKVKTRLKRSGPAKAAGECAKHLDDSCSSHEEVSRRGTIPESAREQLVARERARLAMAPDVEACFKARLLRSNWNRTSKAQARVKSLEARDEASKRKPKRNAKRAK